jgi:putative hydrolase of the HAD superfamily
LKRSEVDAIVFDLFHTIIDPEDFRPKEFRRADVAAGIIGLDKAKFYAYWQATSLLRMSGPRPEIEYLKDFATEAGVSPSASALSEAENALRKYQDVAILNPREEVLLSLKLLKEQGYKIGLLSNTFEGDVRYWHRSALAQYFDAVAFSHDIGITKPDERAFRVILDRLDVEGSRCIFVGDGGVEELKGARRAGFSRVVFMRMFVAANGIRRKEELEELPKLADLTVDSFDELRRWLS